MFDDRELPLGRNDDAIGAENAMRRRRCRDAGRGPGRVRVADHHRCGKCRSTHAVKNLQQPLTRRVQFEISARSSSSSALDRSNADERRVAELIDAPPDLFTQCGLEPWNVGEIRTEAKQFKGRCRAVVEHQQPGRRDHPRAPARTSSPAAWVPGPGPWEGSTRAFVRYRSKTELRRTHEHDKPQRDLPAEPARRSSGASGTSGRAVVKRRRVRMDGSCYREIRRTVNDKPGDVHPGRASNRTI